MDTLGIVKKSSMFIGLILAAVEVIGLFMGALYASPLFLLMCFVSILLIVFGALFVGTQGFGIRTPQIASDAYAIGAGIMLLGFLGITLLRGGFSPSAILPFILVAIAYVLALFAESLSRPPQSPGQQA